MTRKTLKTDLAIIGAGAAGLVTAAGAAMLGRKVVLFEDGLMGGDCLNYGCVPSKAILTAAHVADTIRHADQYGISSSDPQIDFSKVMDHVRSGISAIEPNDSQERFEGMGVTVIRERAHFTGPDEIQSEGYCVRAKRYVVATGTKAFIPPIPGLNESPYLTNETIWDLKSLPEHLIILGGGPIGCELGQAFARLGSKITLVEAARLLGRMDTDHADLVRESLIADGVDVVESQKAARIETVDGGITVELESGRQIKGSHLLAAMGRTPVTDGLGLDAAGIETNAAGIITDDKLRTTNKKIFAAGDIAGKGQLTHLAGWHGSVIVRNLYFGLPTKQSSSVIPAAVYTDPVIASAGLTEADARDQHGGSIKIAHWGFDDNDRALSEGRARGGVKLVIGKGGKLLGAHAAGDRADDLIQIPAAVIQRGGKVSELTSVVAPYPTRGEIWKRAAGSYYEPIVFGPFAKFWAGLLTRFH